jgi:phage terminase small subunit
MLSPKQQRFVAEYLKDSNATQAAIRAGYSRKTAGSQGHDLLKKPEIAAAVKLKVEQVAMEADEVLERLSDIASSDLGDIFDKDGNMLPLHEIPAQVRRAIASFETETNALGVTTTKVKFWDKPATLGLLGRHHKLFTDRLEVEEQADPRRPRPEEEGVRWHWIWRPLRSPSSRPPSSAGRPIPSGSCTRSSGPATRRSTASRSSWTAGSSGRCGRSSSTSRANAGGRRRLRRPPASAYAAKACKGPGKTALLAWVGWWRLQTCRHHRGAAVSITLGNLKSNLWPELALWQLYSPLLLAMFEHKARRSPRRTTRRHVVAAGPRVRRGLERGEAGRGAGRAAQPVRHHPARRGRVHSRSASSTPRRPPSTSRATTSSSARPATAPTRTARSTTSAPATRRTGSSSPSPATRTTPSARRASTSTLPGEHSHAHGRSDPVNMVNFLGLFPPKGGSKLLGLDEVERAQKRPCPKRDLRAAADRVGPGRRRRRARSGRGDALQAPRPGVFKPRAWRNIATDRLADNVALLYGEAKKEGKAPKKIFVDRGGVGHGTSTASGRCSAPRS